MQLFSQGIFTRLSFGHPATGEVITSFKTLLDQKNTSVEEVVEVLSIDPVAATLVLKRANNAYYGMQGSITSLTHAVEILGATSVLRFFSNEQPVAAENIALKKLSQHSLATAHISHRIAYGQWIGQNHTRSMIGGVFTAGLLHNLGQLAICHSYPEESALLYGCSDVAFPISGSIGELEHLQFGADALEVGVFMSNKYRFPSDLSDVIGYHSTPDTLPTSHTSRTLVLTVSAASKIAESLGYGINSQGSLLHSDSSFGLTWLENSHPGKIQQIISESAHFMKLPSGSSANAHESLEKDRKMKPRASSKLGVFKQIKSSI